MLRGMFWNTRGNKIASLAAALSSDHDLDLLVLAENATPLGELLPVLNAGRRSMFRPAQSPARFNRNLLVLSSLPSGSITPVQDAPGVTIKRLCTPGGQPLTLVAVHQPSKRFMSNADQTQLSVRLAGLVREVEGRQGHDRTIVVGDLNMDPFEDGLVGSEGLHAVSSRHVARSDSRTVQGERRPFFYNPMWNHFGDRPPSPPGSYYYRRPGPVSYFWHMFDQLLVRPSLLPNFADEDVVILHQAGGRSLLDAQGRPDSTLASDHLPLYFRLHV